MRGLILGILLLAPVAEAQNRHLGNESLPMDDGMSVILGPANRPSNSEFPEFPVGQIQDSGTHGDNYIVSPCVKHSRKFKNPLTWLKSNMCDADYERWAVPRQHDHFYRSKVFWTGVAIIGASLALDAHSTARGRAPLTESNHVLGQHASNGRIAGLAAADFAAQFSFHFLAYKVSHNDPSRTWRSIGQWGVPSGVFLNNGVKGIKNYRNEAKYN